MMRRKTLFILMFLAGVLNFSYAQDKSPARFGKVTPADFDLSGAKFDSSANAIVIADIGSSQFVGNAKGWFSLEFKHYKRIKILNKKGFDAATVSIPLFMAGTAVEKIISFKAVTYNLEDGKIIVHYRIFGDSL